MRFCSPYIAKIHVTWSGPHSRSFNFDPALPTAEIKIADVMVGSCAPITLFPPEERPWTKSRRQWREPVPPPHSASNHVLMRRPEYFETKASAMVASDTVTSKGGRCASCSEHNRLERPCNVEWSIVFCFTTRQTAHTCQHRKKNEGRLILYRSNQL